MKTLFACLLAIFASSINAEQIGKALRLSEQYGPGDRFMDIRLLGTLELAETDVDGHKIEELSGLAWDNPRQRLYAITDGGKLFHFKPIFKGRILIGLDTLNGYSLRDKNGERLKKKDRDAEGLDLKQGAKKTSLLISFERRPRIHKFSLDGQRSGSRKLPKPLRKPQRYTSRNKMLEAVALHPTIGLITAPEYPLKKTKPEQHRLYIRTPKGKNKSYWLPRYDPEYSAITAISALPDGRLLILERTYHSIFSPAVIGLHLVSIPKKGKELAFHTVALFDNAQGWSMDNFEGLAYLGNNRFLMVSDNNQSPLQSTLLTHFELIDP